MVLPVNEFETSANDEQGEFLVAVEGSDEGRVWYSIESSD
jgi:hypothetical protein